MIKPPYRLLSGSGSSETVNEYTSEIQPWQNGTDLGQVRKE